MSNVSLACRVWLISSQHKGKTYQVQKNNTKIVLVARTNCLRFLLVRTGPCFIATRLLRTAIAHCIRPGTHGRFPHASKSESATVAIIGCPA